PFPLPVSTLRDTATPAETRPVPAAATEPSALPAARSGIRARWLLRELGRLPLGVPPRAAIARAVDFALSTELDRGAAFVVAPVLLAVGALVYFALGREPGFLPLAAGTLGL